MTHIEKAKSPLRLIIGAAGVIIFLTGTYFAATLVNLVLLALLITLVMLPVKRGLQKRGLSPRLAYVGALLVIFAASALLLVITLVSLGQVAMQAPAYTQQAQRQTSELVNAAAAAGIDLSSVEQLSQNAVSSVWATAGSVVANSIGSIVFVVFVLLVVVFMLAEADSFGLVLERTVGADNPIYQNVTTSLSLIITYFVITAWINLLIGIGSGILLWLLGVPYPLLWGVVSFLFGFIPYLGYWIALLPPLMLAFGMGGIVPAAVVFFGYSLINGFFTQLIAPRMYGKGLNLSVTLTVIAVLFWGWLLGSIGGMLAVPLTAMIKSALLASYPNTAWLATVLSDNTEEGASG